MSGKDLLVGAGLFTALAAAYPLALTVLPAPSTIEVDVPSDKPFLVAEFHAALPKLAPIGSSSLLSRIEVTRSPELTGPGLSLTTFRVVHGHRWEQSVTVPGLTGPFVRGDEPVCGLSLALGAGVFDTSGASSAVASLARSKVDAVFPLTIRTDTPLGPFAFTLPKARDTVVRMQPGNGVLAFTFRVELEDGTFVEVRGSMAIDENRGAPVLRRVGDPVVQYGGASFDRLREEARRFGFGLGQYDTALADAVCAGSLGLLCPRQEAAALAGQMVDAQLPDIVRRTVAQRLDGALGTIGEALGSLVRRRWAPLRARPDVEWTFSLATAPVISTAGVVLPLCMRFAIPPPQTDASVSGPVRFGPGAGGAPEPAVDRGAVIRVRMQLDALNAVLFVLWQSGVLREKVAGVAAALPAPMRALAFDWTGVEPLLPPVIGPPQSAGSPKTLPVVLGALRIGRLGERDVLAHAIADMELRAGKADWTLSARARELTTSCAQPGSGGTRLTPCLSDLAPLVNDTLEHAPIEQTFPGSELLARIPALSFASLALRLERPRAEVMTAPPGLELAVDAAIVGPGGR